MTSTTSKNWLERAERVIPGGVNSPVRAFRSVGGHPVFFRSAAGAELESVEGTRYIDYVGSWGPMILGHADPDVVRAIQERAALGTSFGAPTSAEVEMAELLAELYPSMEMSRLTSSGTEAVMGALRVARGFTGRDLVVKFEGCYHGGADYLLVKAGSGAATLGVPDSAGVPAAIASTTITLPFNDVAAFERCLAERGPQLAAVIVEPVVGNMGCVPPAPGFLEALRAGTTRVGALLVFDEVMTGLRLALGGAQARFGIRPNLTTLGKIVGGGLPVGAYGGRRDVMSCIAPLGPVYQAGTLSGNPLAVAAGLATIRKLRAEGVYERLEATSAAVEAIFVEAAAHANVACTVQRVGSMLTVFFTDGPVRGWTDAERADRARFARFHAALLAHGVYWPPSQFEAAFVSLAHADAHLVRTRQAAQHAFLATK